MLFRSVLAGDAGEALRHVASLAAAAAAAAASGLVLLVWQRHHAVDALARILAVGLAAGVPLFLAAWWSQLGFPIPESTPGWGAVILASALSTICAVGLAPTLADRGVLAMALATGMACAPAVLAYRATRLRSFAVPVIAEVANATSVERWSGDGLGILVEAQLDPQMRAVLPRLLRPPFRKKPLDLLVATIDTPAARWLERMEWPVLQLRGGQVSLRPQIGRAHV